MPRKRVVSYVRKRKEWLWIQMVFSLIQNSVSQQITRGDVDSTHSFKLYFSYVNVPRKVVACSTLWHEKQVVCAQLKMSVIQIQVYAHFEGPINTVGLIWFKLKWKTCFDPSMKTMCVLDVVARLRSNLFLCVFFLMPPVALHFQLYTFLAQYRHLII